MAKEKYDVFISYSSQDQKVTEGICGYLEARGVRCFVAYRDIPRGVVWAGHIANAIDVSRMMVVVFSENFNDSTQTDREIELAAEKPMPILTYRISDNQFTGAKKYYLKNLNWIDAFPDAEKSFGVLCENVCQLLDIKLQSVPTSIQQPLVKEQQSVQTSPKAAITEVHIETDADCKMYRFSEYVATLHAGADNVVRLNPGTYKLTFRSTRSSDVELTQKYTLSTGIFTDFIEVQLKEQLKAKLQQEAEKEEQRQQEELERLELHPYKGDDDKYGFIDKTGKVAILCQWNKAESFCEGMAKVFDGRKYGFIDKTGKVIIPNLLEYANSFNEGLALVRDDNWKFGFIDKTGKVVIPYLWDYAESFSDGLALVRDNNGKYGFIDKTCKIIIPCQLEYVESFSEGLARVRDNNGMYGYIDKTGKIAIPCQWERSDSFRNGLACVMNDNWMYGFIDKTGKVVIPCQWKDADSYNEGLAKVKNDNEKFGFIDKTGKVVIPCQWAQADSYNKGLAKVKNDNGKEFYIDKTGRVVK